MERIGVRGRVLISTVSQVLVNAITAVLAIVVLRIATRHLGPHTYGQLVTVLTFVTLCTVVTDLGLNGITIRNLARFPERAEEIIGDNLSARGLLCLLAIPLMGGAAFLIYPRERTTVALGITVMSIDVLFGAIAATCMIWYATRIRNEVGALVALLNRLIYTAAVIAAAISGASLFGYIGATLLADGTTATLSLVLVGRHIRLRPRFRPRTWRANMAGSVSLGLMQIVGTIFLWIDSFLISLYLGPQDVAFYGIAFAIIVLVNSFSSNFMGSLVPTLSRSSQEDVPIVLQRAFYAMLVIGLPVAVGGVLLRHQIIELVAGSRYLDSAVPLAILLSSIVFTFLNNVYGYACVALNRVRVLILVQVPAVALNVALNLLLIPRYGIDAAAAATLVAEVVSFIATTLIFRAKMGIRISLRPAWKPAISAVVMIAVGLAASSVWSSRSAVTNILLGAAVLGMVYAVSLTIVKGIPADIAILGAQVPRRTVALVNRLLNRGGDDQ